MLARHFKHTLVVILTALCCSLGGLPVDSQTFTLGLAPLVDIRAMDKPKLLMKDGKTAIGAETRLGQGIILDADGIIATNKHIIGAAQHIFVKVDNEQTYEATVLLNSEADLTLLKINAPLPLRAISIADPSQLAVGSNVVAVTNKDLNTERIRSGQIIKVFKGIDSDNIELLEMNISLNPGDSGGPILNDNGSLLGLIMGKQISDPSKSYAISSSRIQEEYFKIK